MELPIERLSHMTPAQEQQFWEQFARELDSDTGDAAREHLAAGRAIYYLDPAYPDAIVKEYPDGRRDLVRVDASGQVAILQGL